MFDLSRQSLQAEIAITGRRICQGCRYSRDATTGKTFKAVNGSKRWLCAICNAKRKPGRQVK
jgi:hypothetical protein